MSRNSREVLRGWCFSLFFFGWGACVFSFRAFGSACLSGEERGSGGRSPRARPAGREAVRWCGRRHREGRCRCVPSVGLEQRVHARNRCARWSARSAARTYDLADRFLVCDRRGGPIEGTRRRLDARTAARAELADSGERVAAAGCGAGVGTSGVMRLGGDCAGAAQAGQALCRGSSDAPGWWGTGGRVRDGCGPAWMPLRFWARFVGWWGGRVDARSVRLDRGKDGCCERCFGGGAGGGADAGGVRGSVCGGCGRGGGR